MRRDAPECGVPIDEYDAVLTKDRWERPYVGTALLPGTLWTPHVQLKSALLSVKGRVAIDLWSAAWLYGVRQTHPAKPMLVVPSDRRPVRHDITIRRTNVWVDDHVHHFKGMLTLIPGRLIVDVANDGHDLATVRDLAIGLHLKQGLGGQHIEAAVAAYRRFGERELLAEVCRILESGGSESGLEYLVRELLIAAGFDPDDFQLTITTSAGRRRLDIVFADAKVGIEVQSITYHGDEDAMTRDAIKLNAFRADEEWLVLVLTKPMLHGQRWVDFCATLRHALDERRA